MHSHGKWPIFMENAPFISIYRWFSHFNLHLWWIFHGEITRWRFSSDSQRAKLPVLSRLEFLKPFSSAWDAHIGGLDIGTSRESESVSGWVMMGKFVGNQGFLMVFAKCFIIRDEGFPARDIWNPDGIWDMHPKSGLQDPFWQGGFADTVSTLAFRIGSNSWNPYTSRWQSSCWLILVERHGATK